MKRILQTITLQLGLVTYLSAQVNITAMEYFIDEDPGFGMGEPISITEGTIVDANVDIPTSELSNGVHHLYVRSLDADGLWSMTEARPFSIITPTIPQQEVDLVALEYFIDHDPGVGNGISLDIDEGPSASLTEQIDVSDFESGLHFLHLRGKGSDDQWGVIESRPFYLAEEPSQGRNLITVEYYFDSDPGLGNVEQIDINPASKEIDLEGVLNTSDLSLGNHVMGIRVVDEQGARSYVDTVNIEVCDGPNPDFSTSSLCVGEASTFNDTSLEVTAGDIYRWDFDGDGTFDDFTNGDSSFTYSNTGIFQVHLQIEPVDGCVANLFKEVEVNQLPAPDFTVNSGIVGETIEFTDNSTLVSPTSSYTWDFESDDQADDQTTGSVSTIIDVQGNYIATLTIDNGSGCVVSTSKEYSVTEPILEPLGIDEELVKTVRLYPNPVIDQITLRLSQEVQGSLGVNVLSQNGQLVKQVIRDGYRGQSLIAVDVQDLSPGIYLLNLTRNDRWIWTGRLLKK